jgi:hypothetical protein
MGTVLVNTDLLRELLNAAARTALAHRGSEHEQYVLGQLEATANLAYVMSAGSGDDELELLCQQLALDALSRHSELESSSSRNQGRESRRSLQTS